MSTDDQLSRSQRKARNELLARAKNALQNEDTRYLIRWLLDRTGMFDQAFTGNSSTFYNEGRRDVGLEVMSMLNEIDPYEFVRLMKEGADEVVRKRNEARKEHDA